MKKAILATKVGMTQIFDENGVLVPVTVLQAGPCVVTQVKTADNDGYSAIQVGFGEKKENRVNKPMKGQFAKAGVSCKRYLKEFRFEDAETYTLGQEIKADIFGAGDKIDATATKDSRVPSRDMVSPEDLWLMVPNIIVTQVPMVLAPIRVRYSKEKECQDRWVERKSPYRTWKS
jgi:hypothetical protein